MYRQEGKAIAVIVHVGRGIQVRMSHDHEWNDMKKALIGDLIDEIDDNIEYGLELPVFVFAFSKMRRGIVTRCFANMDSRESVFGFPRILILIPENMSFYDEH